MPLGVKSLMIYRRPAWSCRIALLTCLFGLGIRPMEAAVSSGATNYVDLAQKLPPHPRLLLDQAGISELRQRLNESWASASWAEIKRKCDQSLQRPVELPPRGGNWSHNYVCPDHGARLSRSKSIGPWQWEHVCPVGPHVLHGNPNVARLDFDGNAISATHADLAREIVDCGLLSQVTGDPRYAARGREILLAYAGRYSTYALHDNQGAPGKGGRVASQSLTEASWLVEMAQGADLVWRTLSASEHEEVASKLFHPALNEVIIPRRLGTHNIQCWHNSAIGLVGFLLGDSKLTALAIDDPRNGLRSQLENGVRTDGLWLEGSSGYHFYTISGLWPLAEAARHCGLNLYNDRFRQMFEGPINLAMPDLVLPDFNDSRLVPLRGQEDAYELGYARFQNPSFVPILAESKRRGRLALLYGVPKLPKASSMGLNRSRNLEGSGYAILQRGTGTQSTWLCLKYGPHGGGHGHPDKNNFILYSRGEVVATDAGTHAYGSSLHKDWDKTTFAHNTLVVDGQSQTPATGSCLGFGSKAGVDFAVTDAGTAYKGVRFWRTAALLDKDTVVFADQIGSDQAHTYDLVYHQRGKWLAEGSDRKPFSSQLPGYNHLQSAGSSPHAAGNLSLKTRVSAGFDPSITVSAVEPLECITGYGLLNTTEDLAPALVQRRTATSTAFVWAISLEGRPVDLEVVPVTSDAGKPVPAWEAMVVKVRRGNESVHLLVNPGKRLVLGTSGGEPWRTSAAFSAKAAR